MDFFASISGCCFFAFLSVLLIGLCVIVAYLVFRWIRWLSHQTDIDLFE